MSDMTGISCSNTSRGKLPQINADSISRDILISSNAAKRLGVKTDDALIIYFYQRRWSTDRQEVSDFELYHTGLEEYDIRFAHG